MTRPLVWFKRDLRVHDHAALANAAALGPVLALYAIEPSYWQAADASQRQFEFLRECLRDLYRALKSLNITLHVLTGEVVDVLAQVHAQQPFDSVHSHQETGNALTFARDVAVGQWCQGMGVAWHEYPQHGVVRRLPNRDHWSAHWSALMDAPVVGTPSAQDPALAAAWPWPAAAWPDWAAWGQPPDVLDQRQRGGRQAGLLCLQSFVDTRSAQYRGGISSPLSAPTACSRLSPYLSWGCLSMREVVQTTQSAIAQLPPDAWARKGLVGFTSRLHWHCHFIQKLESEPAIEWRNMHRGYDGLREGEWNEAHFERLRTGQTGWPLVDACVAMLAQTGWLNFRMRAMLVSVAAYPLWLHWTRVGEWLATQFIDYEPGIHWSQMQMQSGTTGINTTRVYNPIKQAKDHDPQGIFVRRWLPVLRQVPDEWLFEPWKMSSSVQAQCGVVVGQHWPLPVVDLAAATREAKSRLHARRGAAPVKAAKQAVVDKHASRMKNTSKPIKPSLSAKRRAPKDPALQPHPASPQTHPVSAQIGLDF